MSIRRELFVGNLAFSVTDESLKNLFSQAGTVESAKVIFDRLTSKSRGFGFVAMAEPEGAKKAIDMFNNHELEGRNIRVNESNSDNQPSSGGSRPPRTGGGGGGGFRSNDGGGYRGNDGGSRGRDGNSGSYNRGSSSSYNR